MRKYIIYSLIITFTFFVSCDKELDLEPISETGFNGAFDTAVDIENAVAGVYSGLQTIEQYGYHFSFFSEVRSDNTNLEDLTVNAGQFGNFETFSLESANRRINETWVSMYQTIQQANLVLNRIDLVDDMSESTKTKRKGEVRFIRALTYFNMVRFWSDVPLILTETEDAFESFQHARTPSSQVYTQIENDLIQCITELPATPDNIGRVTEGAAQALLGKVYLTQGKFSEAVSALQDVVGNYSLLPNFEDVFSTENSAESIFEIQYKSGGFGEGSSFSNNYAPRSAGPELGINGTTLGDNIPTQELYDSFDVADLRRDVTVKSILDGRFYSGKLVSPVASQGDSDKNFIVLRYADALLMLAEALNEVSYDPSGLAFTYLNQIRQRAGLADLTNIHLPDQESFRMAVSNERRWELATENHRWFDLVRTGKAVEVMNTHFITEGEPYSMNENNTLFPIPQTQIDASSGLLTQNSGY
ncbi:RagB/SusD family nutrient uptake outer membrane protein [Seonamhaeicola sp.]|uniref:RagB/SusD family nutrient uptake outer membrane protein n=1 Tax=Seonamhaeicola sp. TaxID=1912245 RepID=UPI002619CC64|nr:RagB/SusD family nutrient uptake outer membrane protein [Seonamhaeicola sp.]